MKAGNSELSIDYCYYHWIFSHLVQLQILPPSIPNPPNTRTRPSPKATPELQQIFNSPSIKRHHRYHSWKRRASSLFSPTPIPSFSLYAGRRRRHQKQKRIDGAPPGASSSARGTLEGASGPSGGAPAPRETRASERVRVDGRTEFALFSG